MLDEAINRAAVYLRESRYAIGLTGAGISTPSGIPDFRSPSSGLWQGADLVQVATVWGFQNDPSAFYNWIYPMACTVLDAQPNSAHLAMARLEAMGILKAVITQNVDMLHTEAGSETVYEVHGHFREGTCMVCGQVYDALPYVEAFIETGTIPRCPACQGVLKPNVILFGESLPPGVLEAADAAVDRCDVMLVVGSSLEVAPVNRFPQIAGEREDVRLIVVNNQPTYVDDLADVVLHADVVDVLPSIVDTIEENSEGLQ